MRFWTVFLLIFLLSSPVTAGLFGRDSAPKLPVEFEQALAASSSATLYSIQPHGGLDIPVQAFHGYHQLGLIDLDKDKARAAISALQEAVSSGNADAASMCVIEPRHGLRIEYQGNTYDFLICYQCHQLEIFKNGKEFPFNGLIGGTPKALNDLLTAAKIPLADPPVSKKQ